MSRRIKCQWMQDKKILVNPDGQVFPCCYLSNPAYELKQKNLHRNEDIIAEGSDDIAHTIMQDYFDHEDELNILKSELTDIINHEWFEKTLPASWENVDTAHRCCREICSVEEDVE